MLTREQVHHDAWAKLFVWPFVEERFAASASHIQVDEFELMNGKGDVALAFRTEDWVHPSRVIKVTTETRPLTAAELREYRPLRRLRRRIFGGYFDRHSLQ